MLANYFESLSIRFKIQQRFRSNPEKRVLSLRIRDWDLHGFIGWENRTKWGTFRCKVNMFCTTAKLIQSNTRATVNSDILRREIMFVPWCYLEFFLRDSHPGALWEMFWYILGNSFRFLSLLAWLRHHNLMWFIHFGSPLT